jgi:hypothetical protein
MGLIGDLFGTPKEHEKEKAKNEVVKVPEFDITQYAKKLGVVITSLAVVGAAALKGFDVKQTEGMVIAVFGVIAAALLGTSLVMAIDLGSRAYLTASGAAEKAKEDDEGKDGSGDPPLGSELVTASPGTVVWIEDSDEPHPLLAIATADGKAGSYLVATGSKVSRSQAGKDVDAIGGSPKWIAADAIKAMRPAKWP